MSKVDVLGTIETKDTVTLALEEKTVITMYIISDIHYGGDVYNQKKMLINNLIQEETDENTIVGIIGDCTDDGFGNAYPLTPLGKFPIKIPNGCCCCCKLKSKNQYSNQTEDFIKDVYIPIKEKHKKVYLIHGNHDEASTWFTFPLVDFLKETHGKSVTDKGFYHEVYKNICFISLGKYPDSDAIEYFKNVNIKLGGKYPYIILVHYNFEREFSDFWSDDEKKKFVDFCDTTPNLNVMCIIHGHIHESFQSWLPNAKRPIPTVCGAGLFSYAKLKIDVKGQHVSFQEMHLGGIL